jgi:hypothetical protein
MVSVSARVHRMTVGPAWPAAQRAVSAVAPGGPGLAVGSALAAAYRAAGQAGQEDPTTSVRRPAPDVSVAAELALGRRARQVRLVVAASSCRLPAATVVRTTSRNANVGTGCPKTKPG